MKSWSERGLASRIASTCLVIAVCLAATSCSPLLMTPAPQNHEDLDVVVCTSSLTAPAADASAATTAGITAGLAARSSGPAAVIALLMTVAYGISSGAGYAMADRCNDAQQAALFRQERALERQMATEPVADETWDED